MSVHRFVSIKAVMAKIIRDVGPQRIENDYQSMKEWISEIAVRFLNYNTTITVAKEMNVENHSAELPCDLIELLAVEHKGCRVPFSQSIRTKQKVLKTSEPDNFITIATVNKYIDSEGKVVKVNLDNTKLGMNVAPLQRLNMANMFYYLEGDWLKTSVEEGLFTIYYKALNTDEEGYPMIPDNSYLHEAIYWYVLWKLVGRGFQHPVFKWQEIKGLYEENVRRAKGSVNYPTHDEYQHMINVMVSYFPNMEHWSNFNKEPNYKG